MKKFFVDIENDIFIDEYNEAVRKLLHRLSGVNILDENFHFKQVGWEEIVGTLIECDEEVENILKTIIYEEMLFDVITE